MSTIADSVTSLTQSGNAWQLAVNGVSGRAELEAAMWPTMCPAGVEILEGMPGTFEIYGLTPSALDSMDADLGSKFAMAGFAQRLQAGATPAQATPAPAPSPDLVNLLAWSKQELDGGGNVGSLAHYTQADWEEYSFTLLTIDSYVQLSQAGEDVDSPEWHRALTALGEARNLLASNAEVAIRQRIADRAANLATEKRDLQQVRAALEDVEKAEQDSERAEHTAEWVMRIKELAEVLEVVESLHEPSPEKIATLANLSSTVKLNIEGFVAAEGRYFVQVTLASHGFASAEELAQRVQTAAENVHSAAEALQTEVHAYDLAKYYHALPIHH